ncbi:MAG TPA: alkaline phosphatase D family protein [Kofleriaceae bacterium]|nr:alkaline phosphatase D family protein [Kofleriaceae bacterium]
MKRRDFLRTSGWFVVGATLAGIPGCGDDIRPPGPDDDIPPDPVGTYQFPQGVASGDPRPDSVVLWTRIQKGTDAGSIEVNVQVATDAGFNNIVVDQQVTATAASDHTVRVLVTGLVANTEYHYRFTAVRDAIKGRTRTAPAPGADVQVNLAWVSCQDYGAGFYSAYRQMILDDHARPAADQIHFVIHLGDVIYETRSDNFQQAIDDLFRPVVLKNPDGEPRAVTPFPSGGGTRGGANFANTVDDYRHLYRTYLADPQVQAARARWPFIQVWDDHEFTNDSWQSQSNYTNMNSLEEGDQARKLAASQAWFEYAPAHLTGATGVTGVPNEAQDFTPPASAVSNAMFTPPNNDNFVDEPNNAAAIGAMTIYRSLRFGKHVELVMTDQRSYRSDHAIPEESTVGNPLFFDSRAALPLPIVNTFDQGKTANSGMPPDTVLGVTNPRKTSPVGTMLGAKQKAWWKATMKGSDATWKLWGNEVPLIRLALQQVPGQPFDRVLTGDAWDGYPTERNELMTYLRTEGIKNVVVLTGDIHATFAGVVMDNYDSSTPQPVSCELTAAGITSNSLFSFFEEGTRPPVPASLRALVTVDATPGGSAFTENFNMWLRHGTNSAGAFAMTKDRALALTLADPTVNPHLKYADTNSQGYGYAKITGTQITASLVTINRPIVPVTMEGPGIKRTAEVTVPKDDPAAMTVTVTGTKPFPLT